MSGININSITGIPTLDKYYDNISFNPIIITVLVVIIILYFIFFGYLGGTSSSLSDNDLFSSDDSESSSGGQVKMLGIILTSIFIVLVLINGFNYLLNINIVTSIKDFFSKSPKIDILADSELTSDKDSDVPEIKYVEQVYHIPNNKYTYEDAKALCKAYGNRLANYKEIESAYENGADWCSYGWSDNQMALYPTQYKHWKQLQKIKGHEHDCGRPGINGGYIANPNVRFGVNCYGYKPKINKLEAKLMNDTQLYPVSQEDINLQNRIKYWKNKINNILISPFNPKKWSRI